MGDVPLVDLIPRLSPGSLPPTHLIDLVDELESAIQPHTGQKFFWFSVPPAHWKTTTLIHAAVKHLLRWPEQGVAYVSHTQPFASKQSRSMRRIAERAGLKFAHDSNRQDEWSLTTGGGLMARGIKAVPAGTRFRLMLIDDPIQGREQAFSQTEREVIYNAIEEDALTRLLPDGAAFLVHTRWHPDDPIGRYRKQRHWRGKNIQALSGPNSDVPLLPEFWGFDFLDQVRRSNPYKFNALYQGDPILKGEALFRQPSTYELPERPTNGLLYGHGVDLAYSAKTTGDWSVCVTLAKLTTTEIDVTTRKPVCLYYVVDVHRKHVDAPSFALTLKSVSAAHPGPMLWYAATSETGAAQFIGTRVPGFRSKVARVDKYQRAQPVSEQWNLGRVMVPTGDNRPDWVDDFVDELTNFTGVKDAHDDQVDALAAAFDVLSAPEAARALVLNPPSGKY